MLWIVAVGVAAIAWPNVATAQDGPVGEWTAAQATDQGDISIVLILEKSGEDSWSGTLTDITGDGGEVSLERLRVTEERIAFNFRPADIPAPGSFSGRYIPKDDTISGTFSVGGRSFPLTRFTRSGGSRPTAGATATEEGEEVEVIRPRKHPGHFGVALRGSYWLPLHLVKDGVRDINDITSGRFNFDGAVRWFVLDGLALFGRGFRGGQGFNAKTAWTNDYANIGMTTDSYLKMDGYEFGLNAYIGPALIPDSKFNPYVTFAVGQTFWEVNQSGRGSQLIAISEVPLEASDVHVGLGLGTEYALSNRWSIEFDWMWKYTLTGDTAKWADTDVGFREDGAETGGWSNTHVWPLSLGIAYVF